MSHAEEFEKLWANANEAQREAIVRYVKFEGLHPHELGVCRACGARFVMPPGHGGKRFCDLECRQSAYERRGR